MERAGRNDPCPCGSGKKYKSCCMKRPLGSAPRKFKATLLSQPKSLNLIERTFGDAIASAESEEKPPQPGV